MTLHFEPLVSPLLILLLVAICGGLGWTFYRRLRAIMSRRYWWLLAVSKTAGLLVLALVIANPVWLRRVPDRSRVQVAVLADASGSMGTRDCGDRTRLQVLAEDALAADSALHRVLTRFDKAPMFVFAGDQVRRFSGDSPQLLPGDTDIDGALSDMLGRVSDATELGAALLLSDGGDNVGAGMLEAAARFKALGVPVHCVGFGDERVQRNRGGRWTDIPKRVTKGTPFSLAAELYRNYDGADAVEVTVSADGRVVDRREVRFDDDQRHVRMSVELRNFTAGFATYKLRVAPLPAEENLLDNVDFAGVRVTEPDLFRVLYYSENLCWDYRYMHRLAEEEERLELDAVIRLGRDNWFVRGVGDGQDAVEGLPEARLLADYYCLIIDADSLTRLDAEALQRVTGFVAARGGGLIVTGLSEQLPKAVAELFPLRALPTEAVRISNALLQLEGSRVMAGADGTVASRLEGRLRVPENSPLYRLEQDTVKPGATTAITVKGQEWVVLAAHHFGAGKVAYLNLADTWQWVMESPDGGWNYGQFWGRLVSWVASSSKRRLEVRPRASKLRAGEAQGIIVDVLTERYEPALRADVECLAVAPDGSRERIPLSPAATVDGRYAGTFIPRQQGEYRLTFRAENRGEEPLEHVADYLVYETGPELQPMPMAAAQLQNLARATGGRYWHYRDLDRLTEIPLSRRTVTVEVRRAALDLWLVMLAATLLVLPDWYLRRRIGLR